MWIQTRGRKYDDMTIELLMQGTDHGQAQIVVLLTDTVEVALRLRFCQAMQPVNHCPHAARAAQIASTAVALHLAQRRTELGRLRQ